MYSILSGIRHMFVAVVIGSWLPASFAQMGPLPLTGAAADHDPLLALIGDARLVMLGEATHGSREFHRERARITHRLIEERGFTGVVFEAPWEPMRRLDAYIRGEGDDRDADAALAGFIRFPRWMWRNTEVRDFVAALRARNAENRKKGGEVGLYGMDLYSLPESADTVVRHLARQSITTAAIARQRYRCFNDYRNEPQRYGHDVHAGRIASCAEGAAAQLAELEPAAPNGASDDDFATWQSARVVASSEAYYRSMYREDESSWNRRERHMADTLSQLLARPMADKPARLVVWAHNTHQGDARATDQSRLGEVSLGQLMRERHGDEVVLIGFTTHRGKVRAADSWGQADRVKTLKPALADSWTALLHARRPAGNANFMQIVRDDPAFAESRLDRAVGVNYLPRSERASHYFPVRLGRQFDAVIHIDVTSAVEPLRD